MQQMKQKNEFVKEGKTSDVTANKVAPNAGKPVRKFNEIKLPEMKQLLGAGVQFGHQANRWNPKMVKFILGKKNDIHIIDVNKTVEQLKLALSAVQQAANAGEVLFVGTKVSAQDVIKNEAIRCGAHFVVNRWPGGLLTNYSTVKESLNKLISLETQFEEGVANRTKQEIAWMKKDWERLNRLYGGVKFMRGLPKVLFVVDVNFEKGAVKEALKLGIPVVAIVDTNADPDVTFPIPANDDALGSINIITTLIADAVIDGNQKSGVKHMFKDYSKMTVESK